ncbi:MAG: DUF6515 family protein [Steroidobacteraceae bacterium]
MIAKRPTTRARAILLTACAALACALFAAGSAQAQHRDDHSDRRGEHIERGPRHFDRARQHVDARFHHDHVYYNRGVFVSALPRARYEVVHRGAHYFFAGGVWYAPRGVGWVVVAPPFGVYVPVLPPFYTTLSVGSVPYYYADDVYYTYRGPGLGYEVVAPPADANVSAQQGPQGAAPNAPPSSGLFIYPKNGQSEQQQAQDRYECHTWAQSQTGFDPTAPNGGVAPDQTAGTHADYDRAMSACLEGRGYTVK